MFPKKINTPSAVQNRNNFPLDHKHVTTSDFGLTQITEFMNLAPTDVVDMNLKSFAQLDPLLVPSFGGARLIHRAFFVPYDFICADWKSFISNHSLNDDSVSSQPQVPVLNFESLNLLFFGFRDSSEVSDSEFQITTTDDLGVWISKNNQRSLSGSIVEFLDFFDVYIVFGGSSVPEPDYFDYSCVFYNSSQSQIFTYYRFTPLGKNCWNLFTQLGYNIGLPSPTAFAKFLDNTSALPLFAITKIFVDNFVDARYNWSTFTSIFKQFTSECWAAYDDMDRARVIHDMLVLCCFAWFDNDLFTSAWQSHSNPSLSGMFKSLNITDEDVEPNVRAAAPANSQSDPTIRIDTEYLSQHMLDVLKSVTSYFTRNNIAGSRPIDILLARFKVKQPEVLAQMSQYLGSFSCDVNISQIVATSAGVDADGQSNFLGDKGGQGTITTPDNQSFHIHFENKYFYGYLIVVSHIMPIVSYYQGLKPHVLQTKLFDFYTPEFDELGSEALPNKVLFSELGRETKMSSYSFDYAADAIFGFVPRYYGYKFGFDTLSGDFRIPQFATDLRAYEMFRHLTGIEGDFDPSKLVNNQQFRIFSDDARKNYDEMFVYQDILKDHFVINTLIECNANRPMSGVGKSLIGKIEGGRDMVSLNPTGKKF